MDSGTTARFEAVPVPTPGGGPLVVELVPAPDPWEVARRLAHRGALFFLDSADRHNERGRYSYVTIGNGHTQHRDCRMGRKKNYDSLRLLTHELPSPPAKSVSGLPPFQGGLAVLLGYELGRGLEILPESRFDEFECPVCAFSVCDWVISFDHAQNRAWIVSTGRWLREHVPDPKRAEARLAKVLAVLAGPYIPPKICEPQFPAEVYIPPERLTSQYPLPGFPGVTSNFDRPGFEAAVARAVEYIHAGDCFQVNLSQRLLAPLREHPLDLYGRLRTLNPAPFAAYFDLGDFQILSASPERFLRVQYGEVETRPIKGTRPRGRTPAEDATLVADLIANPKDRAENVMIVDLMRNDLGRVCEYGSVRVPRVCEVETFRYVHHLVSEVRGKLRPDCGPLDLLRAAFPGGSVTGAPKVRAMEVIAELEPTARGPYCGSLGFVGFDGTMDTSILIRTFTAGRGWVQFPVGGGIVADSDPSREYEETLHKAAGLLKALEL